MEMTAQIGSDLLELQRLDLEVARDKRTLAELPELVELSRQRKGHAKLKAEATRLLGQRKDAETELAELEEAELACQEAVDAAQADLGASSDYRHLQDVERQLSDLAKRLDKIEFSRRDANQRLEGLLEQEEKLSAYTERYEAAMLERAQAARRAAEGIQERIGANARARDELFAGLPAEARTAYDAAIARHRGLGVERLEGSVPSVCRTTLPAAQLSSLRRARGLCSCPYCGRLIVTSMVEA